MGRSNQCSGSSKAELKHRLKGFNVCVLGEVGGYPMKTPSKRVKESVMTSGE